MPVRRALLPAPAATPTRSLLRSAERVAVAAVHFQGNTTIEHPPKEIRGLGSSVTEAWQRLLIGPDDFRVCTAESLAAGIRSSGAFPDLVDYLGQRYGV